MKRFEIGRSYSCRSICDYDCTFQFVVTKRTEHFVWLRDSGGRIRRRKVSDLMGNNVECCEPHGRYSMSPVLTAA
jgi:hypothetical protein